MKRTTGNARNVKKASVSATAEEIVAAVASASAVASVAVASVAVAPAEAPVSTAPVKSVRKRESKKKFPIVAIVTPDGIDGDFMTEPRRPLIAHLPIHSSEVMFHDAPLQYNPLPPTEPDPFDEGFEIYQTTSETIQHQNTMFEAAPIYVQEDTEQSEKPCIQTPTSKECSSATTQKAVIQEQPPPAFSKVELLVAFKNSKQSQAIPETTNIACFWCCHTFDTRPCIIPVREEKGVYEVYGNFCCPECALAYILDERDDSHVKWEKISLLHRIYGAAIAPAGGRIYPAPARATLALFGGTLTVDSYRNTIRDGKLRLDIHLPPMISILATMDTKPIDFYETTIPKSFIPLNSDRMQKADEGLRLKRSKPLKDKENTLDAVMNIQIRRVPVVNPVDLDIFA
jgi:hypothetical protein